MFTSEECCGQTNKWLAIPMTDNNLKIWLIQADWRPGSFEGAVVIAPDADTAFMLSGLQEKSVTYHRVENVDNNRMGDWDHRYYSVKEIALDEDKLIYRGSYCC